MLGEGEAEQGHAPGVEGHRLIHELQQLQGQPPALVHGQRLQEAVVEPGGEEAVGQQAGERGVAVLVIDEQALLLVLHQLLVDRVQDLLLLLLVELQVVEEQLGRHVVAAQGGEVEEALETVRRLQVEVVQQVLDGSEEVAGRQGREVEAQAFGPRRHPLVRLARRTGDGEQEVGIAPRLGEQPQAQGIGELGARHGVEHEAAIPGEEAEQGGQRLPRVRAVGEDLPGGGPRVGDAQQEGHHGRSRQRGRDAGQHRREGTPELFAGGLAQLPAPGDLDLGEAQEVQALLVAFEVEG